MKSMLLDRFLRYVKIETQSNAGSNTAPSSKNQLVLLNLIAKELQELGVKDAKVNKFGLIYGTIPSNINIKVPTVGFLAHVDTASEMSGLNVKPRIIEKYDGKDIVLNAKLKEVTKVKDFPFLSDLKGHTLVVTDGTTLLGADDKAGLAEIMDMVEYLSKHPEIKHGTIKIGITPDEEIGRGVNNFNVKEFGADFAYTMDGDKLGAVEYENFNAAAAKIHIKGKSIHPGSSKNKLVNAIHVAMEFHALLPLEDNPALTAGYEGFNHITSLDGAVNEAKLHYIIRNHDAKKLEKQKQDFKKAASFLNEKYGADTVTLKIEDSYQNMYEVLKDRMDLIELAYEATRRAGVEPFSKPVRGGTDGARLTFNGLPTPNIGTGAYNFHGRFELASVTEMKRAVEVMINIVKLIPEFKFKGNK
jgi:tripeptide aminopeptidase